MATEKTIEQQTSILHIFTKIAQICLYVPIQIVFVPFAIVGLVDAIYKEMVISKRLSVSFTAIQALQYRWFMHYFDTRPDPLSVAFTKALPCESHFGLCSTFGALIIAQRLFGFTTSLGKVAAPGEETVVSTPGTRLLTFDQIMRKHVDTMEQVVILGSGFDLVALRYTRGKAVRVFELDQTNTLNVKVHTLQKANIAHDWITYVPVDYGNESWVEKLISAGFDSTKKTLFLWQSVSLFLEPDAVRKTLIDMADLCVDGSIIAQDFYSEAFISGKTSRTVQKSSSMMARMGEPWKFGIDMSGDADAAVAACLQECGLEMTKINQFGAKLDGEAFYCIVEAKNQ